VGRAIDDLLRVGGDGDLNPHLAKSPLAFLAKADFEEVLGRLDRFLLRADTRSGRAQLDDSLNVLRAALRVENGVIERIAFFVPEGKRVEVATAISAYVASLTVLLMRMAAVALSESGGDATAEFFDRMIGLVAAQLDRMLVEDPRELGPEHVERMRAALSAGAVQEVMGIGAAKLPHARRSINDGAADPEFFGELSRLNAKLLTKLGCIETTPDSRKALRRVFADLGASARMMLHLVELFGAASNERMDEADRSWVIRGSVESMGPLSIKLMQTLVNMQSLIERVSDRTTSEMDRHLFEALRKLQDEVTPLPWAVVKDEIESSLGLPVDRAFVWIDSQPLKSGSIGQTHRAKIETEAGEIADVVVKVLRPGIEQQFRETIRITKLTLSLFRELLGLDKNGAIFGPLKKQAEGKLPMLERALAGFIESFKVETNFTLEASNMKRFAKMLGPSRHVAVPLVYDSHTRNNVLTMQELKGFKLSRWLERYRFAEQAVPPADELGPIDGESAPDETLRRAARWVEEVLGTRGEAEIVKHHHGWYRVRIDGGDELMVCVREKTGRIFVKGELPALPEGPTKARVAQWAEKRFGLPVSEVMLEAVSERRRFRTRDGYRATIVFDDEKQKSATAFVDGRNAQIEPRSLVPDLTAQGVGALRDRLCSSFVNQLLARLIHGDPHEGNFFVLPDGKTIAFMDFGLAIELGVHDTRGPLMLLASALLEQPRMMAEALASMTNAPEANTPEGMNKLVERLLPECERLCQEVHQRVQDELGEADRSAGSWWARLRNKGQMLIQRTKLSFERAVQAMLDKANLSPKTHYLHALKAIFSMSGNLATIEKEGLAHGRWRQALQLAKDFFAYEVASPLYGGLAAKWKAKRIDRISVLDVRALNARSSG
jgi:predicted unusual protein kinase regulating ubiquinone biosynthesis (AarF/ABC1/UbiB family)